MDFPCNQCFAALCINCRLNLRTLDTEFLRLRAVDEAYTVEQLQAVATNTAEETLHEGASWPHNQYEHLRKTSPCYFYRNNRVCPHGDRCWFAHGEEERRCRRFATGRECLFGNRCRYRHD